MMRVLIVEDSEQLAACLATAFEEGGYEVRKVATLEEAKESVAGFWPDFVLLDANFPTNSNTRAEFNAPLLLELLARDNYMSPTVILMSGDDRTASHFDEVRAWFNTGRIADVLPKSNEGDWDFLKELLVHRVELLRRYRFRTEPDDDARNQQWLYGEGIVSQEEAMFKIAEKIRRIVNGTDNSWSILVVGPSGSGKGLVARAIHKEMKRKAQCDLPFIEVDCGASVETIAPAAFLGYVRGAFTGANAEKAGHLENAGRGVLFLNDIHLLPHEQYGTFLSPLQERTFQRVGSSKRIPFDARTISSVNVDLDELDKRGRMPEEYYNRIARATIVIPPLHQRPRDIEPLMRHFLAKHQPTRASIGNDFSPDVIRAFQSYMWPGDVRQLDNVVGNVCMQASERVISLDSLRHLELTHKGRPIDWNGVPEVQRDRDLLLSRVGWHEGWNKITESEFDLATNWLKQLWPRKASLIDGFSAQVKGYQSPRGIHFLKAMLFITLVEGNRARHKDVQEVLGLAWDFTNRVLCFLAGEEFKGQIAFHPPLLSRNQEGSKWVYCLNADLGKERAR